jgi:hypothetical protein
MHLHLSPGFTTCHRRALGKLLLIFVLVYINCTEGFHHGISYTCILYFDQMILVLLFFNLLSLNVNFLICEVGRMITSLKTALNHK